MRGWGLETRIGKTLASFPGHSQISFHSSGEKSGSSLETRLGMYTHETETVGKEEGTNAFLNELCTAKKNTSI